MCLCIVSFWMSLVCHTDHVSLHTADNEHINMYIPSQVNACLALQFHGPVSSLCGFSSTNWHLSIRWRKWNIVPNYWTDTWLTDWLMKPKGKETEKEEKTKFCIVKLIDAKYNLMWGADTKKFWHKIWLQGFKGEWTKLRKLLFSAPFSSYFEKAQKVIPGKPLQMKICLTFKTFNPNSWYLFDSWAHHFCVTALGRQTVS